MRHEFYFFLEINRLKEDLNSNIYIKFQAN